eukprot:4223663-Lingulodinium_polyedra.AAC.1
MLAREGQEIAAASEAEALHAADSSRAQPLLVALARPPHVAVRARAAGAASPRAAAGRVAAR